VAALGDMQSEHGESLITRQIKVWRLYNGLFPLQLRCVLRTICKDL